MEVMTEHKVVPQLRFREFDEKFHISKLKDIVFKDRKIRYGIVQPGKFDQNGRLMIRGKDYSKGWNSPEDIFKVSPNVERRYLNARVKTGDLVLTIVGAGTGRVEMVPEIYHGANITQTTARISVNPTIKSPYFCLSYLNSDLGKKIVYKNIKGAAQPGLNIRDVECFQIYFPSLPEQEKIASFLTAVDDKIHKLSRKKELLEEYKKGVMQKIFSQDIHFKDDNNNDYPDWEEIELGQIFKERSEKGFGDLELLSVTIKEGVKSRSEIIGKDNSSDDKSNYKRVLPNDIAYNSMRMWQGASGVSQKEGIVSPAYTVLKGNNNSSQYFAYFFKMRDVIFIFQRHSQGLTSDTWNFKYPKFAKIKFDIPSIGEQEKIASFLSSIDKKVESVTNQLEQTQKYKKGLLQQMFV